MVKEKTSVQPPRKKGMVRLLAFLLVLVAVILAVGNYYFFWPLPLLVAPVVWGIWKEKTWGYMGGIFAYLFLSLVLPLLIIWYELIGGFEGLGALGLITAIPLTVVIIVMTIFAIPRLWRLLRQRQAIASSRITREISNLTMILVLMLPLLGIVAPLPVAKQLKPWYEARKAEQERIERINQEQTFVLLEENLRFPTYIPDDFSTSFNKEEGVDLGYLEISYLCKSFTENVSLSISLSFNDVVAMTTEEKGSTLNPLGSGEILHPGTGEIVFRNVVEEVEISGNKGIYVERYTDTAKGLSLYKKAIYWHENDIEWKVEGKRGCYVEKEELIRIAESLE